ncbi:hypothetical protein HZU77_007535 [Neisseriaceae bacterium TC5R-5]|nr:hypothetical protein [Neisseriaceae bacterium TC5R-5]
MPKTVWQRATSPQIRPDGSTSRYLLVGGVEKEFPFEHNVSTDASTSFEIVDRPASSANFAAIKQKAEATFNQHNYQFAPAACRSGSACLLKISLRFVVEFVTDNSAQHTINLFPQATRANSQNWGEVNIDIFTGKPIRPEHVITHEIGHLLGYPDEYASMGGAIAGGHREYDANGRERVLNYVGAPAGNTPFPGVDFGDRSGPPIVHAPGPLPSDLQRVGLEDWAAGRALQGQLCWQLNSATTLMGGGVYETVAETPEYYVYLIRDWFTRKTGKEWKVERRSRPSAQDASSVQG